MKVRVWFSGRRTFVEFGRCFMEGDATCDDKDDYSLSLGVLVALLKARHAGISSVPWTTPDIVIGFSDSQIAKLMDARSRLAEREAELDRMGKRRNLGVARLGLAKLLQLQLLEE